jgi:hypothetical protein
MTAQQAIDFVLKCRERDRYTVQELALEMVNIVYAEKQATISDFAQIAQSLFEKGAA